MLGYRDGRTPLHEMAIRGEAPTVLLLATEAGSEWGGGSCSAGDIGTRISNDTGGGGGSSLGTSTNDQTSASGGARRSKASNDEATTTGTGVGLDDGDSDEHERGGGARLSSSSCTTAASLNIVVDEGSSASGGVRAGRPSAARASSVGGGSSSATRNSRSSDDSLNAPIPCAVRSPVPLSNFAAPSLADTDSFYDHYTHRQSDNAATADAVAGNALEEGEASGAAAVEALEYTNTSIEKAGTSMNSSTHLRGSRDAAAAAVAASATTTPQKCGRRGSVGVGVSSNNNGGSEADDSSGRVCRKEGGRSRREGEQKVSGWEGLLEVHVPCIGSGNCPLHEAAASGSVGAVLSLLDLGANVNMVNGSGDTALHVSVTMLDVAKCNNGLSHMILLIALCVQPVLRCVDESLHKLALFIT